MISIIHPSRGRPEKSYQTMVNWASNCTYYPLANIIISLDSNDPKLEDYKKIYKSESQNTIGTCWRDIIINDNQSAVDAINNAAKITDDDILIVVSDDTDCFKGWDTALLKEVQGKKDWILKTQDDIQKYIITLPIMDRAYYNRTGYIYHPEFKHMFCDTYMTCVADMTGRKLTSNLVFHHDNPGHFGKPIDDINRKNDATWKQGEETFLRLMREFSPQDRAKIKDQSMVNWLRMKGIR